MPWRSPALSPKDFWYANHADWAEKRFASYGPEGGSYSPPAPSPYAYVPGAPDWGGHHAPGSYGGHHPDPYGGQHPDPYGGHHTPGPYGGSHGGGWYSWGGHHGGRVRGHVGLDVNVQKAARDWITYTDDQVRDIPVFEYAIWLQDQIFKWADEFGVGPQVREIVYDIRSAEYAGVVVAPLAGAGGALAGASTISIVGGVAALGAAAVVVGIADALFGGDEDAANQARARAQAQVLHLRDRLTLKQFAAEQDESVFIHTALSTLPWKDKQAELGAAALAQKLAKFYRAADQRLDADGRAAFESISNLSRWEGTLREYEKLSWPEKDNINILFGTKAPRLPTQLKAPMETEQAKLSAILKKHARPSGGEGAWIALGITLAAAGGALAVVRPDLAMKGLGYAKTGVKAGAKGATRASKYVGSAGKFVAAALRKAT